jgi:pimeloyl-ACP methyl ester carboxylesterase
VTGRAAPTTREAHPIATFVIVHGAWGGGWEWTPVARHLRARGHEVFTPTLTGVGERAHLGGRDVGLGTHVDDVVAVLELEDLHDVVLCGHSSAGMVVTGVADRVPERVALVVYVDALVPVDGQSALELLPDGFGAQVRAAMAGGDGWSVAMPPSLRPPEGSLPAAALASYVARLGPYPARAFAEPLRLTGRGDRVARAFLRCTAADLSALGDDPIEPGARRARDEGWRYRELVAPHDPQLSDPDGTAAALHELATGP